MATIICWKMRRASFSGTLVPCSVIKWFECVSVYSNAHIPHQTQQRSVQKWIARAQKARR